MQGLEVMAVLNKLALSPFFEKVNFLELYPISTNNNNYIIRVSKKFK